MSIAAVDTTTPPPTFQNWGGWAYSLTALPGRLCSFGLSACVVCLYTLFICSKEGPDNDLPHCDFETNHKRMLMIY